MLKKASLLTLLGLLAAALALAGGVLVWVSFPRATSDDDVPHGVAMVGSAAYVVGAQYDDFLWFENGRQTLWLRKVDLASGSLQNIQTAQCRERFLWAPDIVRGSSVVTDGSRVYVAGDHRCSRVCFSLSGGNQTCESGEVQGDAILVAFDASNLNPAWSESIQSDNEDKAESIARSGSWLYVAGHFKGSHLKIRGDTYLRNFGRFDAYLAQFATTGQPTGRVVGVGGSGDDEGQPRVAVDNSGNVYLTGYMRSNPTYVYRYQNGSPVVLATLSKVGGGADVFVVKLDPNLNFLWGKVLGGPEDDKGRGIAINGSDVYLTGFFSQYLSLPGCCTLWGIGGKDAFGVLLRASDGQPQGGIRIAGSGDEEGTDLKVNPTNGRIWLTGSFSSATLTVGPYTLTNRGSRDGYLVEVDRYGNVYGAASAGGSDRDEGTALATAPGIALVAGTYRSNPFYVGSLRYGKSGAKGDAFLVRLNLY